MQRSRMNLSRTNVVRSLRQRLLNTPLYKPARFLLNKLFLVRARRTAFLDNISVTFWTPTFKIIDDVEQLAEKDLLRKFLQVLLPGDVVWDVGANIGVYALFAAKRIGPRGKVIAFEPEPHTRTLFRRNCILNHLNNVTVAEYALDKENGTKVLYQSATANPATHSLVRRHDYRLRERGIQVQTVRGDTLIHERGIEQPRVMKIDVEGSEHNALLGMTAILRSQALRMLLVEVHPVVLPLFGSTAEEVENVIHAAGFSRIDRRERGAEYHLLCYRN